MKKLILFTCTLFTYSTLLAQSSYIEVKGEPNLSVYLNNTFKGKSTAEFGGFIIENVVAGANLIKIIKDGFIPFEETITIKKGEVFLYKVKPFVKNTVTISETGNSGETQKKATIETGKLIIQSVPINIKITMPSIEGVNNKPKNLDQWKVDNLPTGTVSVTFIYNTKTISKTIEIIGNETTNVFINMINGEFTSRNSVNEKNNISKYIDSLALVFGFVSKIKKEDFKTTSTEYASYANNSKGSVFSLFNTQRPNGIVSLTFNKNEELITYQYLITLSSKRDAQNYYEKIGSLVQYFPKENKVVGKKMITITDTNNSVSTWMVGKQINMFFQVLK